MIKPREDREFFIFAAKVYINEAARRRQSSFHSVLLEWAANARKRAMTAPRLQPKQMELA